MNQTIQSLLKEVVERLEQADENLRMLAENTCLPKGQIGYTAKMREAIHETIEKYNQMKRV